MNENNKKQKNKKQKVMVAMSGGVDSSVAAALLKEQGYDVVGVFMKNWSRPIVNQTRCPWAEDQKDMRRVCQNLGIPHYTFNFEKEYEARVVDYFFREYEAGRTPNPDVFCNKEIKFDIFLKRAKKLGADMIATGHYAQVKKDKNGQVHLYKGKDGSKDQSYFLCMLGQEELADVLFPIGDLKKTKVRELAKRYDLPTAEKKDSQGICFIGPIKVREFLKERLKVETGDVLDINGRKIGEHEGAWFYTIGQRVGIDKISWSEGDVPVLYVKSKDVVNNKLVVGLEIELYEKGLICDNICWVGNEVDIPTVLDVSIRYRQKPARAKVEKVDNSDVLKVIFEKPQRAIAPGQMVVFYRGDELLGGATIIESI